MPTAKQITEFLNEELKIYDIEDSSCNGLQVENTGEINKIGFAVDASQETFENAAAAGCKMLLVHHGIIWDGIRSVRGNTYQKIKFLIEKNMALYAVHLPLDRHPVYGNNAQLAELLKLQNVKEFGYHDNKAIGFMGETDTSLEKVKQILKDNGMKTLTLPFGKEEIKTIAIVSGGAAKDTLQAIKAGVDLYITGEPLHHVHHMAKENKINVIFGGHYETEIWGVKALMPVLKEKFAVETEFIDVPTIV